MSLQISDLLQFALGDTKINSLLCEHNINPERINRIVASSKSGSIKISTFNDFCENYAAILDDVSPKLTPFELKILKKHQGFIHVWINNLLNEDADDDDDDEDDDDVTEPEINTSNIPTNKNQLVQRIKCSEEMPSDNDDDDDNDTEFDNISHESMDSDRDDTYGEEEEDVCEEEDFGFDDDQAQETEHEYDDDDDDDDEMTEISDQESDEIAKC